MYPTVIHTFSHQAGTNLISEIHRRDIPRRKIKTYLDSAGQCADKEGEAELKTARCEEISALSGTRRLFCPSVREQCLVCSYVDYSKFACANAFCGLWVIFAHSNLTTACSLVFYLKQLQELSLLWILAAPVDKRGTSTLASCHTDHQYQHFNFSWGILTVVKYD